MAENASSVPEDGTTTVQPSTTVDGPVVTTDASSEPFLLVEPEQIDPETRPRKQSRQVRLEGFHEAMQQTVIPSDVVESYVFRFGVPDKPGMRALLWKLLLKYLTYDKSSWPATLKQKRDMYAGFVKELISNPFSKLYGPDADKKSVRNLEPVKAAEDPLGLTQGSEWVEYFKDQEIRDEISKDIKRTYSSFSFFNQRLNNHIELPPVTPTSPRENARKPALSNASSGIFTDDVRSFDLDGDDERAKSKQSLFEALLSPTSPDNSLFGKKNRSIDAKPAPATSNGTARDTTTDKRIKSLSDPSVPKPTPALAPQKPSSVTAQCKPNSHVEDLHQDALLRVLFIFAKLNPGIRYVQGMNELLAPIYYVFANDPDPAWSDNAEADAFFCFSQVMSEVRDRFIKSLDSTSTGVIAVVTELNDLLQKCDYELWSHLETLEVDPRFYSFRWITLLASQEFQLPDVLRLWDSLFADPKRFHFLLFFCCAMLKSIREDLLQGDFGQVLSALQHFPEDLEMSSILHTAHRLRVVVDGEDAAPAIRTTQVVVPLQMKSNRREKLDEEEDD